MIKKARSKYEGYGRKEFFLYEKGSRGESR